ncbi:FtsX-like permease family protein [Tissierella praeacuta]|uniref:ABC transporter permease n=1 Tax=Tissierella praeacuta TaxID=43131 RepID=UPI0010E429D5|nr:ABC transporter permease [Tissierella praeacuta]TCU68186.1 FtsX-like permease family protein [Tissierella praeacuta]
MNSSSNLEEKLQNVKNIRQIQSIEDMKNTILEFIDIIIYSVGVMMIFGGVLGFAIVYNVTIVGIGERAMEFSSLRVMGFDKKEIYGLVNKENTIMTFWGLLAGVPLGYGMCKVLVLSLSADMYSIPLIIKPSSYIITAISTIIFIALAQLATIRKIYHLNFIHSLKNRIS